jgi:hypothetical protein
MQKTSSSRLRSEVHHKLDLLVGEHATSWRHDPFVAALNAARSARSDCLPPMPLSVAAASPNPVWTELAVPAAFLQIRIMD